MLFFYNVVIKSKEKFMSIGFIGLGNLGQTIFKRLSDI